MGGWLVNALIIGFFAWVIWGIMHPPYAFLIRIDHGQPLLRKGRVTREFLKRVAVVCQEDGVARGWIGGVRQEQRIALRFSRQFPSGPQQRLRNDWVLAD